jgi:head-tail adaptor
MGGTTGAWTPVSALTGISAKIEAVKGGESVRAQRLSGQAPADITIRWCLDALSITTADRVRDARTNQTYNIGWIGNLDNHQRFLMLSCEAGGLTDD